jgi:hypothetical protein
VTILENILPSTYYSQMAGVLVDIDILYQFVEGYLPDLSEKINSSNFADLFKFIILKWFISLYVQNTTEKVIKII